MFLRCQELLQKLDARGKSHEPQDRNQQQCHGDEQGDK